ncbi:MAG: hypothetical protein A2Y10_20360 [Planctomycetes bacterium GWF2_41_51]|nr:MAG: hypothetical protein A2Y10_20360 [Planctomycetes bacterium GWF2_41_51]
MSTDNNWFQQVRWSPYVVGAGIGILSWISFLLSDHPLGVSGAYAQSYGMIEKWFKRKDVEQQSGMQKNAPAISWEIMLVIGLFIGAFLSAIISRDFRFEFVPQLWDTKFGDNAFIRWLVALIGGFIMGLGARWAGGCTSGHGISGTLQLVVSSWVAVVCFFIGGIAATMFIYYVIG